MPKEVFTTKVLKGGKGKILGFGTKKTGPGNEAMSVGVKTTGPKGDATNLGVSRGGKGAIATKKILKGGKGKPMGVGVKKAREPDNVGSLSKFLRGKESKEGRGWARVKATHRKQK